MLGLAPDGITPDVPGLGQLSPGPTLGEYYCTFSRELSRRGWRTVDARLDWRETIARDAQRLADQVIALRDARPIHLLCHSRGGLVARKAFELLNQAGAINLVGRCAGLGTPHQGSWEAAGLLTGWNQAIFYLGLLLDAPGRVVPSANILGTIHDVAITWPGGYELLPMPNADGGQAGYLNLIYSASRWEQIGQPVKENWLLAAKENWRTLFGVPANVQWIDVVGIGLDTPLLMKGNLPPATPQDLVWGANGDGTVPELWATQSGRLRISTPTSHRALVYDGRVIDALHHYLLNGLTQDVTIQGSVLN